MIVWTPAVLSVLYKCVLYFCICPNSAQLSMFHMERRSRNTLIIVVLSTGRHLFFASTEAQEKNMQVGLICRVLVQSLACI